MKNWMTIIILIMTMGMMTSCDEDNKIAFKLDGEWRGDFGMNYTIEYRGRMYTFDSYDTYLVFYNDGIASTHGWGKQVDYYEFGPYEYQFYRFNWHIRDRVLYLEYPYNRELNTRIYNFKMSFSHFTGWFDGSDVYFDLRKLNSNYDWEIYHDNYAYGDRYNWNWSSPYPYYTRAQATTDETVNEEVNDSTAKNNEFRIVVYGNRFTDKKEDNAN